MQGVKLTLVVPPFGTQMTNEKKKNHHDLMSVRLSMNWARSHVLVCVVLWNLYGRSAANSRSEGERNLAVCGESGK